jgi:hypothetical protein
VAGDSNRREESIRREGHIRRWLLAGALAALGLAAGASFTFGQGSASDSPLNGCVHRKTGKLRLTPPGPRCNRRERRIVWNERGADGRAGAAGAAGPAGGNGAAGQPGGDGASGSFGFDDFDGMRCDDGGGDDDIELTYDSKGYAVLTC